MSQKLKTLTESNLFQRLILSTIIVAGVVAGLDTYPAFAHNPFLDLLDKVVLAIFTLEVVLKVAAEGSKPWKYFTDPWNVFDFAIVVGGFLPVDAQYVVVFRLLRLLRVLKLVRSVPRLQRLVSALLNSIPSMFYIGCLLFLLFYVFGVTGTLLFGANDPLNFGTLPKTMLTLFKVVTMEAWPDILRIEQFGCAAPGLGYPEEMKDMCTQSEAFPLLGPLYFIAFILMGTMVIMNLFIGVIINGMEESQEEEKEFERAQRRLRKQRDMSMELDDMAVIVEKLSEQLNVIRSQSTLNDSVLTQQEPLRAELIALRRENEALKQKLGAT